MRDSSIHKHSHTHTRTHSLDYTHMWDCVKCLCLVHKAGSNTRQNAAAEKWSKTPWAMLFCQKQKREEKEERKTKMTRHLQQQLLVRAKVIPFAQQRAVKNSVGNTRTIIEILAICMWESETTTVV